jgi:hypothetical protein
MNKNKRLEIYNKYGGHCAYCGDKIKYENMQVDHWWPKTLRHLYPFDIDNPDNTMPSCQPCNIHKGGMRPDWWRSLLSRQVAILLNNANFKRALRFGQVKIQESPIVFYFETKPKE